MEPNVSLWLAFAAGMLSFLSPCTLPLFPSYIGYISGVSFQSLTSSPMHAGNLRRKAFLHAVCFCLGLSFLFVLLGWSATALGAHLIAYKNPVRVIGGLLVILLGLSMAGVLRFGVFMRERRFRLPVTKPLGYLGSVVVGVVFAAGWTPCIGPIVGAVLAMVVTHPGAGRWFMVAYAIGFSLPFLIFAVTLTSIRPLLKYTETLSKIGGWLLTLMGVLLATNQLSIISMWIQQTTGFSGF